MRAAFRPLEPALPAYAENLDCSWVCIPPAQPLTVSNECRNMKIQLTGFGLESSEVWGILKLPCVVRLQPHPEEVCLRAHLCLLSPFPVHLSLPYRFLWQHFVNAPFAQDPFSGLSLRTSSLRLSHVLPFIKHLWNIPHLWSCSRNLLSSSWE